SHDAAEQAVEAETQCCARTVLSRLDAVVCMDDEDAGNTGNPCEALPRIEPGDPEGRGRKPGLDNPCTASQGQWPVEELHAGDGRSPLGPALRVSQYLPDALRCGRDIHRYAEVSHVVSGDVCRAHVLCYCDVAALFSPVRHEPEARSRCQRPPQARCMAANAYSPEQCPGATAPTRHAVYSACTSRSISSSGVVTRWSPPTSIATERAPACADSRMRSIPGCEQPTRTTWPSGVSSTSDSSGVSGNAPSGSRLATSRMPGAISTVLVTRRN